MVGITTMPASFSFLTIFSPGACANDATGTLALMMWSTRLSMSSASVRMLTPKFASVADLISSMACTICSKVIGADARMPRPPALDVAAVSLASATQPIPVCTMG